MEILYSEVVKTAHLTTVQNNPITHKEFPNEPSSIPLLQTNNSSLRYTLSVNYFSTRFLIFLLRDPAILEG